MTKKLAIVGSEKQTRENAPWDNEEFDIWVFNEWAQAEWCKRYDAVIELHTLPIIREKPEHWAWLQERHVKPVYMQRRDLRIPDSMKYPLWNINNRYLTNLTYKGAEVQNTKCTASYALALAIYQGYEYIQVYGIEMAHSSEYHAQQPNFAFWLGVASQHAHVDQHCNRALVDGPLYGYEGNVTHTNKLHEYSKGLREQISSIDREKAQHEGALMFAQQMINEFERGDVA